MAEPFRLLPALPAAEMQTYNITSRPRPATCEEVDCRHYREGWATVADEATDLGRRQAVYIRGDRTRKHSESRTEAGLTRFDFEPGQKCFGSHTLPWEGREAFIRRGGDFRGNPRGDVLHHRSAADWLEDFALHQQSVAEAVKRG
jgi:hypothetical protein